VTTPITTIAGAIQKGLSLWESFINTRQEAYSRKQDKRQEKAIQLAEKAFEEMSKLFEFLVTIDMSKEDTKLLNKFKVEIYRLKSKFNKYD